MNAATLETTVPPSAAMPRDARSEQRIDSFLSEIPTETSLGERRLLFDYFTDSWDGRGAVIEIGPFLGGTTRAIAAGMVQNPKLSDDAALYTFDRFGAYYDAARLRQTIQPLVERCTFTAVEADRLCAEGRFLKLFEAIHRPHAYFKLLRTFDSPMPDLPEEIDRASALAVLDNVPEIAAVFVDGCKSWASTRYAMAYLLPRLKPGAPVIFQDFGWYTCFWISAAAHALREFFVADRYVDSTYVFRLKTTVTKTDVERRFPKKPEQLGAGFFKEASDALFEHCKQTGDLRGELISQLHHVAALMTLKRQRDAAAVLQKLNVQRYAAFAHMMRGCLKSPTYEPGGKQILWKKS